MANDRRRLEAECAREVFVSDTQAQVKVLVAPEALVKAPELAHDSDSECSVGSTKGVDVSLVGRCGARVSEQVASEAVSDTGVRGQLRLERCQVIVALKVAAEVTAARRRQRQSPNSDDSVIESTE